MRQCVNDHGTTARFWNQFNVIYPTVYVKYFEHEVQIAVLCDLTQTDREVKQCISDCVIQNLSMFLNQLNAIYLTAVSRVLRMK